MVNSQNVGIIAQSEFGRTIIRWVGCHKNPTTILLCCIIRLDHTVSKFCGQEVVDLEINQRGKKNLETSWMVMHLIDLVLNE